MKPPWILLLLSFAILTSADESTTLNLENPQSPENPQVLEKSEPKNVENKDKTSGKIPKEMCLLLKDKFSSAVSNLTACAIKFARPIEVCLRCRDEYLHVRKDYEYMEDFKQDNISCKVILTQQDRLGLINQEWEHATGSDGVWQESRCNHCYEKNDPEQLKANHTTNFEELWDKTILCFRQFIHLNLHTDEEQPLYTMKSEIEHGSLCTNCSEIYNKMRHYFWNHVVESTDSGTIGGVCYDIRDRFNLTGLIWSEKFDCEPKPETWPIIWLPILVTVLAFIITYGCEPFLVPRLWPGRLRRNTDLAQPDVYDGDNNDDNAIEDDDEFLQGHWEVLDGVTANEYVDRFVEVEIKRPDGTVRTIDVPPNPAQYYEMEYDNSDWVPVPKACLIECSNIEKQYKRGEITKRQKNLMQLKVMHDELNNKKKSRHPSSVGSVVLDDQEIPLQISPQRTPEQSHSEAQSLNEAEVVVNNPDP